MSADSKKPPRSPDAFEISKKYSRVLFSMGADLFPGALVYFGSDVKADFYIKRDILETSVSALQANKSIASCMLRSPEASSTSAAIEELPPLPSEEAMHAEPKAVQGQPEPSTHKQTGSDPSKVPKWLKLPGKK